MTEKSSSSNMDDATYSLFLYYWFLHFRMNENYRLYCVARRNNDAVAIERLEAEFDQIAQLYKDWGDIYFFEDGTPIKAEQDWERWLNDHIHLFLLREPSAVIVSNPASHKLMPGHLVINVSLTQHKSDVLKMLRELIDQHYAKNEIKPAQLVRYPLHDPLGKLNKSSLVGIQKAHYVGFIKEIGESNKKNYGRKKWGHYDTALAICEAGNKDLGGFSFNWTLPATQQKDAKSDDVDLMELGIENRVKQVRDYLTVYDAHVRNTIHGKFPCKD